MGQTLAPCALLLELFIPGFLGSCLEQFGVFSMLCDSKEGESDHCVCHLDSTGLFSWKALVSKFLTPHTHTHTEINTVVEFLFATELFKISVSLVPLERFVKRAINACFKLVF